MSRIVLKTAHGPFKIKEENGGKTHSICMCGLSKDQPFCDDSHKKTLDEKPDKVYQYDADLNREELDSECCGEESGCCDEKSGCVGCCKN